MPSIIEMNEELRQLFEADQRDRNPSPAFGSPDYVAMRERDHVRLDRIRVMLQDEGVAEPDDMFHAAMVFQHSDVTDDICVAHLLAARAAESNHHAARFLSAASYDRWLMYQGQPQKYGTQIVPDGQRFRVWDVEPQTSDEERASKDVPPLADMERRAERMTRTEPQPAMGHVPVWLREAIARWQAIDASTRAL